MGGEGALIVLLYSTAAVFSRRELQYRKRIENEYGKIDENYGSKPSDSRFE